jgi:hypothetical protein
MRLWLASGAMAASAALKKFYGALTPRQRP